MKYSAKRLQSCLLNGIRCIQKYVLGDACLQLVPPCPPPDYHHQPTQRTPTHTEPATYRLSRTPHTPPIHPPATRPGRPGPGLQDQGPGTRAPVPGPRPKPGATGSGPKAGTRARGPGAARARGWGRLRTRTCVYRIGKGDVSFVWLKFAFFDQLL